MPRLKELEIRFKAIRHELLFDNFYNYIEILELKSFTLRHKYISRPSLVTFLYYYRTAIEYIVLDIVYIPAITDWRTII